MKLKTPFAALLIPLFLLSGCFGIGDSSTTDTSQTSSGTHSYSIDSIVMTIPNDWDTLTPTNFGTTMPPNTIAAVRNNVKNPIYTANVTVSKNELSGAIASLDYSLALGEKVKTDLSSFQEISREKIKAKVASLEVETLFLHFEGRETPDADLKQFIQIALVKDKTAFIVTGSALASESDAVVKTVQDMVRSFQVK